MDPNLLYTQYFDMTRRFFPQFLSLLPATPPPLPSRTPPQNTAPAAANESNIIFVEGDAGAAAYHVPPGGKVVVFDSLSDRVYIKTADADGKPHTQFSELHWEAFRAPDDPANRFVTIDDFRQFKDELTTALKQIAENASAQSQKESVTNA